MAKMWERIHRLLSGRKEAERLTEETATNDEWEAKAPTTDGDALFNQALFHNGDFGWSRPDTAHKRVILVNPRDCSRLTVFSLMSAFRGTGHSEWEGLLANWLLNAVREANVKGLAEADVTCLFDRDLLAKDGRTFTKSQIWNHIIRFFDIVEEDEHVVRLRAHVA